MMILRAMAGVGGRFGHAAVMPEIIAQYKTSDQSTKWLLS
jgi:hypothetical protein